MLQRSMFDGFFFLFLRASTNINGSKTLFFNGNLNE